MRSFLKRALSRVFVSPGISTGIYNIADAQRFNFYLARLQSMGLAVKTVYDIGAHVGNWSCSVRKALPNTQFYLFEARDDCAPELAKTGFAFFTCVLSSERKTVVFYEGKNTGDSYYRENTIIYDGIAPTERPTTTLDRIIEENKLPLAELIKLDTQGSELDILEGGSRALNYASVIYIECPLVEYNRGAPNIGQYLDFMRDHGFVPYQVCEQHFLYGALLQIDIMFVRKTILFELLGIERETVYGLAPQLT